MNGRLLSVVPSADVNWLLSTEVQSGAALVAIVGGLLVARLTGLSGDRTYLRRAARDADAELALVREYRADAEADLSHLVANHSWFMPMTNCSSDPETSIMPTSPR
ncbi:MAG TPA: hypothetical protein VF940_32785 [Streptosporangiaceae bacterium]